MKTPEFIAHRGYPKLYPENTLIGIEAALKAGATYIEVDIQLTKDKTPVLFHDLDLKRITDTDGCIHDYTFEELQKLSASEASRFGDQYMNIKISALSSFVSLLKDWPDVKAFIEIKKESLDRFGTNKVTELVMDYIDMCRDQCIPISYSTDAIRFARELNASAIGWVLEIYNEATLGIANELSPDFLFCNYEKIPEHPESLWPGPWQWALYEVVDPKLALRLCDQGADLIETMDILDIMHD